MPVVLRWIADGYDLDWLDGPPERWACYGNHTGALEPEEHLNFLRAQLPELIQMGAVRVARVKPWLVRPWSVPPWLVRPWSVPLWSGSPWSEWLWARLWPSRCQAP